MKKSKPLSPFVTIPETVLPGGLVVPAFEVSRYVCTQGAEGAAASTADGAPWVNITFAEAQAACKKAGGMLERESQRLALAYQIAAQDENWTGGKVGKGKLFQGFRNGEPWGAKPASFEPKNKAERRWFVLPGGERIWDVAGNVFQWVFDDVQGDKRGLIAKPFAATSPSMTIPYPAKDVGQGWLPRVGADWSGDALLRGGCWCSGSAAGVFALDGDWPVGRLGSVGFRCTKPIGL